MDSWRSAEEEEMLGACDNSWSWAALGWAGQSAPER